MPRQAARCELIQHRDQVATADAGHVDPKVLQRLKQGFVGCVEEVDPLDGFVIEIPGNTVTETVLQRQRESARLRAMSELVFEITQEADGGYVAEALGESIVTQADSWEELRVNVREAVKAFYFDRPAPASLRLHLVRDEVIA